MHVAVAGGVASRGSGEGWYILDSRPDRNLVDITEPLQVMTDRPNIAHRQDALVEKLSLNTQAEMLDLRQGLML